MSEILWITIAILTGALLLPVLSKLLSRNDHLFRRIMVVLLVLYILVVLYETLLSRRIMRGFKYQLSLFWSYREAFALYDDSSGLGLVIADSTLLKQIILNILLYIPFGYLLPLAIPQLVECRRCQSRSRASQMLGTFPWRVLLLGVLLSMATEVIQLFFRLGLFELDDILNNTLGCLIGVVLYQLLLRPKAKRTE